MDTSTGPATPDPPKELKKGLEPAFWDTPIPVKDKDDVKKHKDGVVIQVEGKSGQESQRDYKHSEMPAVLVTKSPTPGADDAHKSKRTKALVFKGGAPKT